VDTGIKKWHPWPVDTGIIFDTRVHGQWTRVVCTELNRQSHRQTHLKMFLLPLHIYGVGNYSLLNFREKKTKHHCCMKQTTKRLKLLSISDMLQPASSYNVADFRYKITPNNNTRLTIRVSRFTRKVKPIWILQKQKRGWQWHQLGHMQVYTSP